MATASSTSTRQELNFSIRGYYYNSCADKLSDLLQGPTVAAAAA